MRQFGSIEALQKAGKEELLAVNDIGEVSAECILKYFASEKNQDIIARLQQAGVNMHMSEAEETGDT